MAYTFNLETVFDYTEKDLEIIKNNEEPVVVRSNEDLSIIGVFPSWNFTMDFNPSLTIKKQMWLGKTLVLIAEW